MSGYLQQLTVRLATGIGLLPAEIRDRHTNYLLSAQQDDEWVPRKRWMKAICITLLLRCEVYLSWANCMENRRERAAKFLSLQMTQHQTIVDFFSLFYGANLLKISAGIDLFAESDPSWTDQVAQFLNSLRRDDGGFAKAPQGKLGSTYNTFLIMLVLQLIDRPIEQPEQIVNFLNSQLAEDGGWREIKASKRAGTNPTAAAAASLHMIDSMNEDLTDLTIDFLLDMQTDEGGLRANTRIPIADLLSSFTGGLTLQDFDAFGELDVDSFQNFVNSLQLESGGFMAAVWDQSNDVEYTFYGLGCLALIENYKASVAS